MTCAMHLQDPCEGVTLTRSLGKRNVPLCTKHIRSWENGRVPFFEWSATERIRWAEAAAGIAIRKAEGGAP